MRAKLLLTTIGVALAFVLCFGASAEAQTGYGSTVSVLGGQIIKINGIACKPGATVIITLDGVQIATTTADATGAWSTDVQIPVDQPPGTFTLNATCDGQVVFTATIQVQGEALSRTGASHIGLLIGIGAAAIVLGMSFVLGARVKRRDELTPTG